MVMRGYLKSNDAYFPLLPKITTIGRESCDFVINNAFIDQQHAVLEYIDAEKTFVLKDLGSVQGTFVNNCRIQNASVRLAPGDIIGFGFPGGTYEFIVEQVEPPRASSTGSLTCPPLGQRSTWQAPQPISLLHEVVTNEDQQQQQGAASGLLPNLVSSPHPSPSAPYSSSPLLTSMPPRAPAAQQIRLHSRPLSAGNGRRYTAAPTGLLTPQPPPPPPLLQQASPRLSSPITNGRFQTDLTLPGPSETFLLQDQAQRIFNLEQEVERVQRLEASSSHKDRVIEQLRHNVALLAGTDGQGQMDPGATLARLMEEVNARKAEVAHLRDQLARLQQPSGAGVCISPSSQPRAGSEGDIRQELVVKVQEAANLRNELEHTRKDRQITGGLVTQLQRDLTHKDTTISRLTREIEGLKREVGEKDVTVAALQAKFSRIKDTKKDEEEREARERELIALRQKFKASEMKLHQQTEEVQQLTATLETTRIEAVKSRDAARKLGEELDAEKAKLVDLQRTERISRVDAQEATKKYERFRNRVMQLAFSIPGVRAPENEEIRDDQLMDLLRRIAEERNQLHSTMTEIKEQCRAAEEIKKLVAGAAVKLAGLLEQSTSRLGEGAGRCAERLRHEIALLTSQSVSDECLQPVKMACLNSLQQQLAWQQDIELALNEATGGTMKTGDSTAVQLRAFLSRVEECNRERDKLRAALESMEQRHADDMARTQARMTGEVEARAGEAAEKARLEAEERLRQVIEEIKMIEAEKLENAISSRQKQIEDMEITLGQLRQVLVERQSEHEARLSEFEQSLGAMSEQESTAAELRRQLADAEAVNERATQTLREQLSTVEARCRTEVQEHREQAQQHAKTICAMEERLNKVVKENTEMKKEAANWRKEIADLQFELRKQQQQQQQQQSASLAVARPREEAAVPPPIAPISLIELAALERSVAALRQENVALKKLLTEKEDQLTGLRRDLTGAEAKLTDVSGEMSEEQKRRLEEASRRCTGAEKELHNTRVQLSKLSDMVEELKSKCAKNEEELTGREQQLAKLKSTLSDRDTRLQELEQSRDTEREQWSRQLNRLEQDGRISEQLTSLGAQCRGERHDLIIDRQKEALADLRRRIKELEKYRSPVPSHDQAVQQIVLLKKELAELRARQEIGGLPRGGAHLVTPAWGANLPALMPSQPEPDPAPQTGKDVAVRMEAAARETANLELELNLERTAHKQAADGLELSEECYIVLLRAIASNLELESIGGLSSMGHMSDPERQRLKAERDESCRLLTQRIKVLRERIARKEELLVGYEQDMAKLKQAEELANRKSVQLENMVREVRLKTEEIELLRESLSRAKEMINQERRLNTAIKQKKPYVPEKESASGKTTPKPKFHCPPEDIFGKEDAGRKATRERLKRKDYEIKTLRSELSVRDKELSQASNRLVNLETTMGIRSEEQLAD